MRGISALAVAITLVTVASAHASPDLFGLTTGGGLVRLNSADLTTLTQIAPVAGLKPGEAAVAFTWGYNPVNSAPYRFTEYPRVLGSGSHLYTVDGGTGLAAPVGSDPFAPHLEGTYHSLFHAPFGRLQTISDTGQFLTINAYGGCGPPNGCDFPPYATVTDTKTLAYAGGDASEGTSPDVVAAAYRYRPPEEDSTLYGVDAAHGSLVAIDPSFATVHTIGPLGVAVGGASGLAVQPDGTAVLATAPSGADRSHMYAIDLSTGAATSQGTLPAGQVVRGLAFLPPTSIHVVGVGHGTIDAGSPGDVKMLERRGDPGPAASVAYSTACGIGGCPTPGTPVPPQQGRVSFAPGQTHAPVPLTVFDTDPAFSSDVVLQLSDPSAGVTLEPPDHVIYTVVDDQPELDLGPTPLHSNAGTARVKVTRSQDAALARGAGNAVVNYRTDGGTAVAGRDYASTQGKLEFGPGDTEKTFAVGLKPGAADGKTRIVGLKLTTTTDSGVTTDKGALAVIQDQRLRVRVKLGSLRHRVLSVSFKCSAPCKGSLSLRLRGRTHDGALLARTKVDAPTAKRVRIRLRLSRHAIHILRKRGRARASLNLRDALGSHAKASRRLNL